MPLNAPVTTYSMGRNFAILAASILPGLAEAGFWRMNCGKIQVGRLDPVVSPGAISSHVHNIVGGYSTVTARSSLVCVH